MIKHFRALSEALKRLTRNDMQTQIRCSLYLFKGIDNIDFALLWKIAISAMPSPVPIAAPREPLSRGKPYAPTKVRQDARHLAYRDTRPDSPHIPLQRGQRRFHQP